MFRQMLFVQWSAVRFGLLPFVAAAVAVPFLVLRLAEPGGFMLDPAYYPYALLEYQQQLQGIYPGLATAVGALLALSAWSWDHRTGHVYALSLPVPRWLYVLHKMAAGALLLLAPAAALWLGSALAVSLQIDVPEGLRAYPGGLAQRFLLASLLVYGCGFALAAATTRTVVRLAGALLVAVLLVNVAAAVFDKPLLVDALVETLVAWPSPFSVFSANWMLLDV